MKRLMQICIDRAHRLWRFAKAVMRHPRVPGWLKYALGVMLLIPGPVDEMIAVVVLVIVAVARWDVVRESWEVSR